jgi:hypothetical protein
MAAHNKYLILENKKLSENKNENNIIDDDDNNGVSKDTDKREEKTEVSIGNIQDKNAGMYRCIFVYINVILGIYK